jgi:cyclic beta-1,2-glucan synthetase
MLRAFGQRSRASPWNSEELLREELFSVERLEQHGRSLAAAQPVSAKRLRGRSLTARLGENARVLLSAYRDIASAVHAGRPITPAAEWLLDNYHVIEEQIREIRVDLPAGFYRELPKFADGHFAGYPRVFSVAWAYVAHTDSHFDPETLRRFVRAYQSVQPLTIGELWAVAITLRVVLVENMRRAAQRIVSSRIARQEADAVADRLLGVNGQAADPDALVRAQGDASAVPAAFVVQLAQRLRDQDPAVTPALVWLEKHLSDRQTTADQVVHDEHQRQGASNVTVRNIITSMRLISDVDWAEFFESVSLVDDVLRSDSNFAQLDFATRNLYRSAIEKLARGSRLTEVQIAQAAVAATQQQDVSVEERARDPGYHLIASGRRAFEAVIGYRPSIWSRAGRFNTTVGAIDYIGGVVFSSAVILALALLALDASTVFGSPLPLFALLGVIPAIDMAVALLNRSVTRRIDATILPALALREGVPAALRTMVVVPTLLTTKHAVEEEIERLEIHYLASPEGDFYFALLSDWVDCPSASSEEDDTLLKAAAEGVARLNARHGSAVGGPRFLLLHRRRVWSEGQKVWMGWERKRGKLHELNRLLRGATDTTFVSTGGRALGVPDAVRYVITLDADTRLPRDTARRLVGKLAHPLNKPRFDAAAGRVVEGYAVLQPRVTPSLPTGREGSIFQRVFSSASGIDPYAAAVSDVYQDLLGEGSYTGKGIYDVDAFEAALAGRVPDGTLLSHDLFEGIFARAGLASDIEVVEEFPARYDVSANRQHRWARGDWQLLPWIFGRRDAAARSPSSSHVSVIGWWKMVDNLRRTLSAPAAVAALLVGWTLPLRAAAVWTALILLTIAIPTLLPVLSALKPPNTGVTLRSHLRALGRDLGLALSQTVLLIVFLAHQAALMADAILRTLYRLFGTHRNLLEWVPAAQAKASSELSIAGLYRRMAGAVAIGVLAAITSVLFSRHIWFLATPFVVVWLASPAIAFWISRAPLLAGIESISIKDANALRRVARRTWRFFETFVTADDNMLPPDNFQEDPNPVLAHRTSPTNMGLYLLSAVSARDFGWAGTGEILERLEATLATMARLQRFRGHFYNWYDTRDLRPLDPRYVSSVDSGNLAGHLIALANACREWIEAPIAHERSFLGVRDALSLTREALEELPDNQRTQTVTRHHLEDVLDALADAVADPPAADSGVGADTAARLRAITPHTATLADMARTISFDLGGAADGDLLFWAEATQRSIASWLADLTLSEEAVSALKQRLAVIETTARTMAEAMQFGFLMEPERRLLSIGYLAAEGTLDSSCYDLLASEARLASFIAIAKSDVPARHWFRLGRAATPIGRGAALISWAGSMFEYLMPSLIMRAPTGSLLEQTNRLIVRRQIEYGTALGVPWGISESAYNARDLELTYQYSNFGVPGLGLKRGLSENAVIAPYATALAAMIEPYAAARNFARLTAIGARGRYGFYEALDYTPSRLPEGTEVAIVRAFMAHHQGMTVVAIANTLMDSKMRERFHAEPQVQATELLLQERTPRDVSVAHPRAEEVKTAARVRDADLPQLRRMHSPHSATAQVHLLSNSRYAVMLTTAASGYSMVRDLAVTRWREDVTRDDTGSYIFLRNVDSGEIWSAGYQPSAVEPDSYEVTFTEDRAEFIRVDANLTTTLEVVVSPEDDAEVRRVSVTNTGARALDIEITSYAEVVLAPPAADAAHQTFSKLFVQTEYVAKVGAILATRRKRAAQDPDIWAAHYAVVDGEVIGDAQIETDRVRFLGRGRGVRAPIAIMDGRRLSNTTGTVLDAVFALRYRVRIAAGATARVAYWTLVASSRAGVLDLVDKHHDGNAYVRAATLAWTQAQVQLRHLGIDAEEAALFQRLAGPVLYANSSLRPSSDTIRRGGGGPAALWSQGISGDLPIVLVRIDDAADLGVVRQLLRAHEYWRLKRLAVDLVILNERAVSYAQDLQTALETLVRTSQSRPQIGVEGARGSVYALRTDLIAVETRALLSSVARVVLVGARGTLAEQLERLVEPLTRGPPAARPWAASADSNAATQAPRDLEYFNGLGGFSADGREYVTILSGAQSTPCPWINVIANPTFGFQVAVEGGGYTWALNSRENQLTPWSNDPATDRPGEVLYVQDEDTAELWTPTASPINDERGQFIAHHGQGYSRFERQAHGIELELLQYVPLDDAIKISRLKIHNISKRTRRLSITAYAEWVLSSSRSAAAPFIVTELDAQTGAIFATNPWNTMFRGRVAFADLGGAQSGWTADRREFLGRHGTLERPAGIVAAEPLSKQSGAGLDPCAALQRSVRIEPDGVVEIVFFLGQAPSSADAQALIKRYRTLDLDQVLRAVVDYWDGALSTLQVKTPDRDMDIILNRWMLYQTLACRMWARSAFYQASGAYGFRDQLQDSMALCLSNPALTREHLLRAAGRQFVAGDVQHWWLPSNGQGVRTRISDDRAWLAHCAAHYIESTGDAAVLDEQVQFLEGRELQPGEHDAYFLPDIAEERASLYEHCARALDHSLAVGEHGLPLMGTGDWNDGMNRVGEGGKGESVWLAWLLHKALVEWIPIASARGDSARSANWLAHTAALNSAVEEQAWDGDWYRRGYFDDGTPLGSASSVECRIDCIAQSWGIMSGAAEPARAARAMAAVEEHLILQESKLALLFTPPFDKTPLEPGYIKGYPPGIRENGGQYTHAATWSIFAFAGLGQGERAAQLFSMLNPINHARTRAEVHRYKVEPYIVAADIYSVAPHTGRGGWTWYTGSAGWLYRAGVEAILGLKVRGASLTLDPCIPRRWPRFELVLKYRRARYEIEVQNPDGISRGVARVELDGVVAPAAVQAGQARLSLVDDAQTHRVRVVLG